MLGKFGLIVALASCSVQANFGGTEYRCPDGQTCPDGFFCVDQVCREQPGQDGGVDGPGADGDVPSGVRCGAPALISDDFSSGIPWWSFVFEDDGGSVSVAGGGLVIVAPPTAGDAAFIGDSYHTTIIGNRMSVEITDVVDAEPVIVWVEDRTLELELVGANLIGSMNYGGSTTSGSVPYDPVAHRFWSFAEADGVVSIEVSADGVAWTTVHSRQADVGLKFGHFEVALRSTGAAAGTARFDNLMEGGPPAATACTIAADAETFDDSLLEDDYVDIANEDCGRNITGGRIRFALSNAGGAQPSCGVDTKWRVDLRDSSFGVEVVSAPPDESGLYHYFQLEAPGGKAAFYIDSGSLYAEYCAPGCFDLGAVAVDPVAQRFWRFRVEGALSLEVSPDRVTWTTLGEVATPFDLGAVQVNYRFGNNGPSSAVLELDNFGPMP